jgi:hypothetical protein
LLYFSSWFYLNYVTLSKWLCFISHKLSTYCYYLFFLFANRVSLKPGLAPPASEQRGRGGGGPRLAVPPRPTISDSGDCSRAVLRQTVLQFIGLFFNISQPNSPHHLVNLNVYRQMVLYTPPKFF